METNVLVTMKNVASLLLVDLKQSLEKASDALVAVITDHSSQTSSSQPKRRCIQTHK